MKRIGIITFHCAYNYGAVLQAYALKVKLGNDAEIINYCNDYFKNTNHYFIKEKNLIKKIIKLVYLKKLKVKTEKFNQFKNLYLINETNELKKELVYSVLEKYDTFVTGSDQVWNLECTGGDSTYFLDFAKGKKRYSYAASFGKNILKNQEKELLLNEIANFTAVSVREKTAMDMLTSLGIDNIHQVIDPTLLLNQKDWEGHFKLNEIFEKYILVYNVTGGSEILEYAKKIAKKNRMPIYYITSSIKPEFGVKRIMDAGPIEWMEYIKNASLIITNSYHGIIFSLIFKRKLVVYLAKNNILNSTRITELLEMLEISEIIRDENNKSIKVEDINYKFVDRIIKNKAESSMDFLKQI